LHFIGSYFDYLLDVLVLLEAHLHLLDTFDDVGNQSYPLVGYLAMLELESCQLLVGEVLEEQQSCHAEIAQDDDVAIHLAENDGADYGVNWHSNEVWKLPGAVHKYIDIFGQEVDQLGLLVFDLLVLLCRCVCVILLGCSYFRP